MALGEASASVKTAGPHPLSRRLAGFGWAAVSVVIFSGWFVITRFSVTRELRIWDIIALRFGIGALLLAPAILRRGSRIGAAGWFEGWVFALLWGLPFVLLVAFGLQLTSAAQAASVAPTLMPVFAGIFATLALGEQQGAARWFGYGAIIVGLIVMVAEGSAHVTPNVWGLGALILAAATWAAYTLLFRRSHLTSIQSAALICIWSAVMFLPAYVGLGLSRLQLASARELALQMLYQGVLMSGVALFTFNRAVSLLGPTAATAIIAFLPAVATVLAALVLRETPNLAEGVATAVVVAGALLVAKPSRRFQGIPAA